MSVAWSQSGVAALLLLFAWKRRQQSLQEQQEKEQRRKQGQLRQLQKQEQSDRDGVLHLARAFPHVSMSHQLKTLATEAAATGVVDSDVYGRAQFLQDFEREIASAVYGFHGVGMFAPSGIMSQQIALMENHMHSGRDARSVFVHPLSHLVLHEQGAPKHLLGFECILVGSIERPMSYKDFQAAVVASRLQGTELPSTLIVEIPHREIGGQHTSFDDLIKIREICTSLNIKLHLDGARLWEAVPWFKDQGKSIEDVSNLFDSIYVSFYKGLGALTGAMLLSKNGKFMENCRVWLRRFGGNLFSLTPYALSCRLHFRTHWRSFDARYKKLVEVVAKISQQRKIPGDLFRCVPSIPECPMVHVYLTGNCNQLDAAKKLTIQTHGIAVYDFLRGRGHLGKADELYFEWKMGPDNISIPNSKYLEGWNAFFGHLAKITATA